MSGHNVLNSIAKMNFSEHELSCAAINSSPVAQITIDLHNCVQIWNKTATKMFGWEKSEITGKTLPVVPEYLHDEFQTYIDTVSKNRCVLKKELTLLRQNGNYLWANTLISPIEINEKVVGIMITAEDSSLRSQVGDSLVQSGKFTSSIIDAMDDGISILDCNGLHSEVNPALCEMTGFSRKELIGTSPPHPYWPEEEYEHIQDVFRKALAGDLHDLELTFKRKNGERFPVTVSPSHIKDEEGNIISYFATVKEITEKKKAEKEQATLRDQAAHLRKMDAIGQLAGGIAHDFNNILNGITGFSDLLLLKLDDNEVQESKEITQKIANSAIKAASLTQHLLMFARKGSVNITDSDAHKSVLNVADILRRTIDKRISISLSLGAEPCTVSVDAGQFESALLNLAINARDSMPEGGTITFEAGTKKIDSSSYNDIDFNIKDGMYRCISITDTGMGIEKENLSRIFEPFFTTKNVGMGTGLGLAGVYGFTKQHNGYITVKSKIGYGSTFTMYLPAVFNTNIEQNNSPSPGMIKGTGMVMVVEDEKDLRELSIRILESLGYDTISFCNGKEAADYFKDNYKKIDIVMLDVIMPVLNGTDCFILLKKIDPTVKVIVTTGFGEGSDLTYLKNNGVALILKKPYNISNLSQILANIQSKKPV